MHRRDAFVALNNLIVIILNGNIPYELGKSRKFPISHKYWQALYPLAYCFGDNYYSSGYIDLLLAAWRAGGRAVARPPPPPPPSVRFHLERPGAR